MNSMRETANTNDIKGMRETGTGVGRQSDEQYEMDRGKYLEFITGHVVIERHKVLATCSFMIIAGILSISFHTAPSFTKRFSPQRWITA